MVENLPAPAAETCAAGAGAEVPDGYTGQGNERAPDGDVAGPWVATHALTSGAFQE